MQSGAVPGHWEGDLISGSNNSHIATLVERNSRYTILAHLNGKDTDSVVQAITREMMKRPINLRKTLTWDRGMEMAKQASFTIATEMAVYCCDPQSPWAAVLMKIPIDCSGNTSQRKHH